MTDLWTLRPGDLVRRRPRFPDDPNARDVAEVRGTTPSGLVLLTVTKPSGLVIETLEFPEDVELVVPNPDHPCS